MYRQACLLKVGAGNLCAQWPINTPDAHRAKAIAAATAGGFGCIGLRSCWAIGATKVEPFECTLGHIYPLVVRYNYGGLMVVLRATINPQKERNSLLPQANAHDLRFTAYLV
jgi:hypothetical protein